MGYLLLSFIYTLFSLNNKDENLPPSFFLGSSSESIEAIREYEEEFFQNSKLLK